MSLLRLLKVSKGCVVVDLTCPPLSHYHVHHLFQAELSSVSAETCDLEATILRLETQLWQRGVRILSPESDLTRYQAARSIDPDFSTRCNAYTQLAGRFREKAGVELERRRSWPESTSNCGSSGTG